MQRSAPEAALYYATNRYYAVAIHKAQVAHSTLDSTRRIVADAYLYDAGAFPIEISFDSGP